MNAQELIETLEWRYATKVFNPDRRIPAEDWEALLESLHLSPSSLGLQMWKFLDVRDPAVRSRLREVSWGQPQVTDASHLVVFCARRDFKSEDVQRYLERIVEVRGVAMDSLDQYRARIFELVGSKSPEVLKAWLERQVYIALGFMMSCAADLRVDTCALEGMDPAAYDRILHLENSPYYTLCALALGYRNEEADKVDGLITFNKAISRVHCKVAYQSGNYYIIDLGSANGTYVNSKRLQPQSPELIRNGDRVRLANDDFTITI